MALSGTVATAPRQAGTGLRLPARRILTGETTTEARGGCAASPAPLGTGLPLRRMPRGEAGEATKAAARLAETARAASPISGGMAGAITRHARGGVVAPRASEAGKATAGTVALPTMTLQSSEDEAEAASRAGLCGVAAPRCAELEEVCRVRGGAPETTMLCRAAAS
mmetsp:Transcript_112023/g.321946  ORF Transcript_112023/g.321946 Transcript_112023/m.321946 type:complete len:167 (+) Transcript_112023:359-859(+)